MPQIFAKNRGNIASPSGGLGNHCSIRLSYGANGGFPRFPLLVGQTERRKTRNGGLNMVARLVAHSVLRTFQPPPRPGDAVAWGEVDERTGLLAVWTEDGLWTVDDPAHPGSCYFIGWEGGHAVKIGHAGDVESRRREMQCGSPFELRVLAATFGGREREARYHAKFWSHRIRGEWFALAAPVLREIDRLNALCPYRPCIELPDADPAMLGAIKVIDHEGRPIEEEMW